MTNQFQAIFAVLQFIEAVPELGSWTLTLVTILLPLSAIWAGVVVNDPSVASRGHDSRVRLFQGHFSSSKPEGESQSSRSKYTWGSTSMTSSHPNSQSPIMTKSEQSQKSPADKIQVAREWSVQQDAIEKV